MRGIIKNKGTSTNPEWVVEYKEDVEMEHPFSTELVEIEETKQIPLSKEDYNLAVEGKEVEFEIKGEEINGLGEGFIQVAKLITKESEEDIWEEMMNFESDSYVKALQKFSGKPAKNEEISKFIIQELKSKYKIERK